MADDQERPLPGDPIVESSTAILTELLEINRSRLREAQRIEKERRIVFPETSVIIRNISRIMDMLEKCASGPKGDPELLEFDLALSKVL